MEIITRAQWGARPPDRVQRITWSARDTYVQHYSGASRDQSVRAIQDYHMDVQGWSDIGYAFLVDWRGQIYEGRGWDVYPAATQDHNWHTFPVCFIGRDGDATPGALTACRWLYDEACARKGGMLFQRGHKDFNPTDCPGDELYRWVRGGMPIAPLPAPIPPSVLMVDGRLGPRTITRWQTIMGTTVDGVISTPSELVSAVQRHLNRAIGALLEIDGIGIRQDGRYYHTAAALQRYMGTPVDGVLSAPVSMCISAVQRRLNTGTF